MEVDCPLQSEWASYWRTEKTKKCQVKENLFFPPNPFKAGYCLLLSLSLDATELLVLIVLVLSLWAQTGTILVSPESSACWVDILALLSLCNHMIQFLKISQSIFCLSRFLFIIYLSIHTSDWFCFFGEHTTTPFIFFFSYEISFSTNFSFMPPVSARLMRNSVLLVLKPQRIKAWSQGTGLEPLYHSYHPPLVTAEKLTAFHSWVSTLGPLLVQGHLW